ncbi:post-GPI attachment to proteins factor 3 [Condylostylus longicornis]|uniref:post-GPI attachment to proteins factor 3 n=1 Tax=Condylostylus longicornis TaxID=2530218 RepID=UPI00244E4FDB|nr:post-GPI attachment to proteins factor 3 [Condylostylus longicornis]
MKSFWKLFIGLFFTLLFGRFIEASIGDNTQFFQNCKRNCENNNCTKDFLIKPHAIDYFKQSMFDKLLGWTCNDECQYDCMWRTVEAFKSRKWNIPQFYGKWPFVKYLGLQEPASAIFSLMNLFSHYFLLKKFQLEVPKESPCYKLWHTFSIVCMNGWMWSTIFHARDFPTTEFLDYISAYSIVLVNLYCFFIRMLHKKSFILKGVITAGTLSFYINYCMYLKVGRFDYGFNIKLNIITGAFAGVGWLVWCFLVRKNRPYFKKIMLFYVLLALFSGLEVLDFPPLWWTFDAHALWHLSSVPLTYCIYSFVIDDCKSLYKEGLYNNEKKI